MRREGIHLRISKRGNVGVESEERAADDATSIIIKFPGLVMIVEDIGTKPQLWNPNL